MGAFAKMPGYANTPIAKFIARRTGQATTGTTAGVTPTLVTTPVVQSSALYGG